MKKAIAILAECICLLVIVACSPGGRYQYSKPLNEIVTWQSKKWSSITQQQFDYSCGAGALSTLIEYYYFDSAPEALILTDIFKRLLGDEIDDRKNIGLSMMDLKVQAESMGYIAAGVKLSPESLIDLPGPVIVLLKGEEVNHFVVLKGIRGGRVYLADPRRGNIRLSIVDFIHQWDRGLTLILGKPGVGLPQNHLLSPPTTAKLFKTNPEIEVLRDTLRIYKIHENFPQRKTSYVRQDQ